MNVISVHNLTKIYEGSVVALDGINFSVEQGEIFALLGPNGAGKTTLFKALLGITQITSGSAEIFDLPPSDSQSRQNIGYLPENHRFPDYLTGFGLLQLTGRLYGCSQADIDSKAQELLEQVGMTGWATTKMRKYSKGMSQRIGLAQAMISNPEILFLDEPTDGVDPVGKIEIRKVLEKIRTDGKSIMLNSHLLSEVESIADRVAILSKGRVLKIGSIDELTSRRSQYEIEADIGNRSIEIPAEIGKILKATETAILIELAEERNINFVIDGLRKRDIAIRSVKPVKITLEQSFLETITDNSKETA